MANGLLQLEVGDTLEQEASEVFSQLGLDLPTAVRMFLIRSVQVRGIPFAVRLSQDDYSADDAIAAMRRMSEAAEAAGISDMSLDEINAEINAVRSGSGI
ncbi:MAG: type II toxin-antitoxin system RelB/DinJ family antitoxin [Atopobiaceae bacterium]|nr:type II toxin-antitoxin system RelB/DinJ family antitoxin [Atopobiaceae bacterium]